jgi:hypothetical protein
VKIDVEGFELEVLQGAIDTLTRGRDTIKIVCEMHTSMWQSLELGDEIVRHVSSCGLRVFDIMGQEVDEIRAYGHYVIAEQFN